MSLSDKMSKIRPNHSAPSHPISYLLDPEYGFYIEGYFIERLMLERQRTERSKKPFLMMLLDVEKFSGSDKKEIKRTLGSILFSSTRETDLKGWYKHDSVIGVLFTEICDIERDAFRNKLLKTLCDRLDLEDAKKIKIAFHFFPENEEDEKGGASDNQIFYPDQTRRSPSKKSYFLAKRIIDILGSIALLILSLPFFIVIPVLIKLSSSGPIIFKQERVGLHGKKFPFLKFRSMYVNNDSSVHREYVMNLIRGQKGNIVLGGDPGRNGVYKITNDTRITPLGRYLRKLSLDEIPQLINVLKGDMSLVGPRPPVPYEMEKYEVWHRRRVLEVKPGLSGLWQIEGRSEIGFNEMVRLDLKYLKQQSLWLDIKILLKTPWVVLKAKGAY
jgi:lipopolysaccharide/colanic/teichoic acid biosynthesis glycosyltransferase